MKKNKSIYLYIIIVLITLLYLDNRDISIQTVDSNKVELIQAVDYKIDYAAGDGDKKYYLDVDNNKLTRTRVITRDDIKKYDPESLFFDPVYMSSKIRTIDMRHGGWPDISNLKSIVEERGIEFNQRLKECDIVLLFEQDYACKKFKGVAHYFTIYSYDAKSQGVHVKIPFSSDSVFTQDQRQLFYYLEDNDARKGGLYVHDLKSGQDKRLLYIKNIFDGRFTGPISVHSMTLDQKEHRLYFSLHLGGRHMWPGYSFYGFVVYDLQKNGVIYYETEKDVGSVQQILPYDGNRFGVLTYSDTTKKFTVKDYKYKNNS